MVIVNILYTLKYWMAWVRLCAPQVELSANRYGNKYSLPTIGEHKVKKEGYSQSDRLTDTIFVYLFTKSLFILSRYYRPVVFLL